MNPNPPGPAPIDELDLLRRLRQLPREREPGRDLWPSLQARLETAAAPRPFESTPRRRPHVALAVAASLLVALGLGFGLRGLLREPVPAMAAVAPPAMPSPGMLVRFEAEAIAIEYRTALAALPATPMPPELQQAAHLLDDSAAQLREALREQPDAPYLLERLRHTYDQRLRLSQRALAG